MYEIPIFASIHNFGSIKMKVRNYCYTDIKYLKIINLCVPQYYFQASHGCP